jgi:subtilisin-like proprotein convertase family protein
VVGRTNSFTAAGTNGGVITVTLQLRDGNLDLGTVDFTFPLGNTVSFNQPDDIEIPAFGEGNPFPSTINVSGLTGTVSKVTVVITNLNHTFPDDIDMLLVGPSNRMTMLMSDAGGPYAVTGLALTFDDEASTNLPDILTITSGTYWPTNYDSNDLLPPPAPPGPYTSSLATFNGGDPNGAWSLYVYDDSFGDQGRIIGGWTLNLSTVGLVQPPQARLAAMPINQSGQFDYLLKGEPGGTYEIEVSTDLQRWTPVSTNTLFTGTLMFHDRPTQNRTQRFYRALRRP